MIIDATNLIAGRLATVVAKKALLGEEITIVNAELAVFTGDKKKVLAAQKQKRERGAPLIGPFVPRQPDRMLKRTIRGMLPYKQPRGEKAFKSIICYVGLPKRFEGQDIQTIEVANVEKVTQIKYVTIGEICKLLGGNV